MFELSRFSSPFNEMAGVMVCALASHAGGQDTSPRDVANNLGVSENAIDMMSDALLRYSIKGTVA